MNRKQLKNAVLVKLGFASRRREKNRVPRVLFYHGVSGIKNPFVEGLHISPEDFRKQIDYLQRFYVFISIDEYYQRWKEGRFTGKEVTLTFDDGYRNNLTVLAPILKELGIPFTVFVSTFHIDSGERFATFIARAVVMHESLSRLSVPEVGLDFPLKSIHQRKRVSKELSCRLKHANVGLVKLVTARLVQHLSSADYHLLCRNYEADAPMTWEEVARLQSQYQCTIGSHCLDHIICDAFQDSEEIRRQICQSKTIIEEKLGQPCHYLAYPNGNACAEALEASRLAGYRLAFTTDNRRLTPTVSPYAMPRYGVNFDLNTFIAELAYKPK